MITLLIGQHCFQAPTRLSSRASNVKVSSVTREENHTLSLNYVGVGILDAVTPESLYTFKSPPDETSWLDFSLPHPRYLVAFSVFPPSHGNRKMMYVRRIPPGAT